ncbi:MAG: hypothetical protein AAGF04_02300 [Chlamydiota bacterium]
MRLFAPFLYLALFITTVSLFGAEERRWELPDTYDGVLQMVHNLDSGEFMEERSLEEAGQALRYLALLAREGALPNQPARNVEMEEKIQGILCDHEILFAFSESHALYDKASLSQYLEESCNIVPCGGLSSFWKNVKNFVKEHKKEIIIGTILVVAAVTVTAGVLAVHAANSPTHSPSPSSAKDDAAFQEEEPSALATALEESATTFKSQIIEQEFFEPPASGEGLSLKETGRALGLVYAYDHLNQFQKLSYTPQFRRDLNTLEEAFAYTPPLNAIKEPLDFGFEEIDRRFANYVDPYALDPPVLEDLPNCATRSYQMRGEAARYYGFYGESIENFTKAIELSPKQPLSYLQRSIAHFDAKNYEESAVDFLLFEKLLESSSKEPSLEEFSLGNFTCGFARGLPTGIYESGTGTLLFLSNLISEPIQTAHQMYTATLTLVDLARSEEWDLMAEYLCPEIHQLVLEWDTLSSDKRGELAGYAFGKHGANILMPSAIGKVAKKSAKGARRLRSALKRVERSEELIVIETAARSGKSVEIGHIFNKGKDSLFLGEELGISIPEMARLKKAGKLEETLKRTMRHLSFSDQESLHLFSQAEKSLRRYKGFRPESEVRKLIHNEGICTFPRPAGIPKDYRVKISDNGCGMKYVHPKHTHTSIRVMPGKPHSQWSSQRRPYVIIMKNGDVLDNAGNLVLIDTFEAHIPVEEFVFIGD